MALFWMGNSVLRHNKKDYGPQDPLPKNLPEKFLKDNDDFIEERTPKKTKVEKEEKEEKEDK